MIHLLLGSALAGSLGTAEEPRDLDRIYEPRRVAVVIGVDSYEDPALTDLRFAAKDARDLSAALDASGDFDRVLTVTAPAATNREGIYKALEFATADLQRDDTFLLYLSGHGTLTIDVVDGTELWFLPSDGRLADAEGTGIPIAWLEERVAEVEARRRVLVMDTCHNGREGSRSGVDATTAAMLESMRGAPPAPRGTREVSESEARLYAAQYYQPAMEDPELENGVYTHFLIEAMEAGASEADLDGDGLVDVTEAHDWARDRTITYTGGLQVPRAEYRIVGREEIYLAGSEATRTAAERALIAATDQLLASAQVLIDGQARGVLPEVVAVEPGRHTIEVRDDQDRTLLKRTTRLAAGETVMVEDLFPRTTPSLELVGGGVYRHGPGAGVWHDQAGALELALVNPSWGPRWLEPDLHLGASAWRGELEAEPVEVTAGTIAFGATLAWRPTRFPVTLGPAAGAVLQWRRFDDFDPVTYELLEHRQAGPAAALGGRATLRIPLGERYLVARYDLRVVPYSYGGMATSYAQHGVGVGIGQHLR